MFSFDTEALNKKTLLGVAESLINTNDFLNTFASTPINKIKYGVQQLYTIGYQKLFR